MDVMEEILTRLPVKHVLRCKILFKSCYDLIKSPRFIKEHYLLHSQLSDSSKIIVGTRKNCDDNGHSLIVATLSSSSSSCYELGETQISVPPCYLFRILVGSCNGLVVWLDDRSGNLVVYNPWTRKNMLVPKPPLEQDMWRPNHVEYNYESALGFAHDARSGDYKLVKILKYSNKYGSYSILIQVWSMNTNSWTQINPPSTRRMLHLICGGEFYPRYGLLVNGILYWLAHRKRFGQHEATIVSFDTTNTVFGEIAFPKEDAHNYINLIDFMGSLALSLARYDSQILFDIWVMGSDSVWTKRFLIGPFPRGVTTSQMCINGNFVLYNAVPIPSEPMEDCEIILCDPNRNQVVMEAAVKGLCKYSSTAWGVIESLVSV